MKPLENTQIAILVDNGFEEEELTRPREALEEAGALTHIVSPAGDTVRAWDHTEWGGTYDVDIHADAARPEQYDALLLPGGVMNPDSLRRNPAALRFVRKMADQDALIAAICHGAWTLIDAGLVDGKRMTSYPSIQTDLVNAGAHWINKDVVVDGRLITSRRPDDIPVFTQAIINHLQREPAQ